MKRQGFAAIVILLVAVIVLAVAGVWYYFPRNFSPAPVAYPTSSTSTGSSTPSSDTVSTFGTIPATTTQASSSNIPIAASTSSSEKFSIDEVFNNNACDIRIINNQTKAVKVIPGAVANAQPEDCEFYCSAELSPGAKYIVNDCGTSPIRDFTILNVADGSKLKSFNGYDPALWLSSTSVLINFVDPQGGWVDQCTSGAEAGISKYDVVSGAVANLKSPDATHSYTLGKLSADSKTISYALDITPQSASGSPNCYESPVTTYWTMDLDGNTLSRI